MRRPWELGTVTVAATGSAVDGAWLLAALLEAADADQARLAAWVHDHVEGPLARVRASRGVRRWPRP